MTENKPALIQVFIPKQQNMPSLLVIYVWYAHPTHVWGAQGSFEPLGYMLKLFL